MTILSEKKVPNVRNPSPAMMLFAGIDVGGTKTDAVLLDESGVEHARARVATRTGVEGVVESVLAAIAHAHQSAPPHIRALEIHAAGVGTPGAVDVDAGMIGRSVHLDIEELPLAALVSAELSCDVHVDNDVNLAAFGLARSMHPRAESLVFLNLGTGFGAGVIVDGSVVRGQSGAAGEIGHLCFDPSGPRCECGMTGCIELFASGSGLLRASGGASLSELFASAHHDPAHSKVVDRFSAALAEAIRIAVQTYDPEVVALGGGVFASRDVFMPRVLTILDRWSEASRFIRSLNLRDRLHIVDPTRAVAASGAALWAVERQVTKSEDDGRLDLYAREPFTV